MKVKLAKDWHVKAVNGSPIAVPEGTEVDLLEVPESAENTHPLEVAVGAKMHIAEVTAPPEKPEKPEIKPPEKPVVKPPEKPDLKPPIIDKPKPPAVAKPKGK